MDYLSALFLGVLQGLTEFLPVSSSGHLVIGQNLLGWKEPEILLDLALHMGTFAAVLWVFREDVRRFVRGGLRFVLKGGFLGRRALVAEERLFFLVFVASIPTGLMGVFFRHWFEAAFGSLTAVAANLLVTGTFLWLTRYARPGRPPQAERTASWTRAALVGVAQGVAIAPGISRSGATISAALFLGFDRDFAARFSFLLFIPAVGGAMLLELRHAAAPAIGVAPTLLGVAASALTGWAALTVLLKVVRRGNFHVFAPYCWTVGAVALAWSLFFR